MRSKTGPTLASRSRHQHPRCPLAECHCREPFWARLGRHRTEYHALIALTHPYRQVLRDKGPIFTHRSKGSVRRRHGPHLACVVIVRLDSAVGVCYLPNRRCVGSFLRDVVQPYAGLYLGAQRLQSEPPERACYPERVPRKKLRSRLNPNPNSSPGTAADTSRKRTKG